VGLPAHENTIRGYANVSLLLIDEARVDEGGPEVARHINPVTKSRFGAR
jgi:hypothetical protein